MQITDADLVRLIDDGTIVVPLDNPETIEVSGRTIKAYLIGKYGRNPNRTRWAFGLRIGGKRRTIVRSKLVWLAGSRRELPGGFEVHHLDEDRYNDAWENLVACSGPDHDKFHANKGHADAIEFLNG